MNDVDARATWNNVQDAITNWLATRSDGNDLVLIYFVNHGGDGGFFFLDSNNDGDLDDPQDTIRDFELVNWLNQLTYLRLTFILEGCFSGDFIDDASGNNRIIITSTDGENFAAPDTNTDWPAFSHTFFSEILMGHTIGNAFEIAYNHVMNNVWSQDVNQNPLLDDNGDSIGNNGNGQLPAGGDGNLALITPI